MLDAAGARQPREIGRAHPSITRSILESKHRTALSCDQRELESGDIRVRLATPADE
jgi:hypothetical protein